MALSMTFARAVRRSVVRSALLLSVLWLAPQQALALPFDPVPSAFERWLNAKRDWPNNQRL